MISHWAEQRLGYWEKTSANGDGCTVCIVWMWKNECTRTVFARKYQNTQEVASRDMIIVLCLISFKNRTFWSFYLYESFETRRFENGRFETGHLANLTFWNRTFWNWTLWKITFCEYTFLSLRNSEAKKHMPTSLVASITALQHVKMCFGQTVVWERLPPRGPPRPVLNVPAISARTWLHSEFWSSGMANHSD